MERRTFTTNFWLSPSSARKNGVAPVNVTITLNGLRASFSTNKMILPSDWDATRQRVKGTNETSRLLNDFFKQIKIRIYQKEIELLEKGYILTAELLRDAYQDKIDSLQSKTLNQVYDDYLSNLEKVVGKGTSKATYYSYVRTLDLLKVYMKKKYKRGDVVLLELNYSFIDGFNVFLMTDYNHRKNTAVKHIKCLKRVVNLAIANRYLQIDPFLNFKVERERVEREFLTEEELRMIINKDFSIARLERVRDIFIFCCFTGLSYSDVKTLDESHFIRDDKSRVWIKKHRVKTGVLSRVPLLPIPKLILEKYKGGEKILPVIDISSTNVYLKEIADLCGINKVITFHTARYTFATTVTISNRVSLEVVSKMMGHTNVRMTCHYAKIIDRYIAEEMDVLENLFDDTTL